MMYRYQFCSTKLILLISAMLLTAHTAALAQQPAAGKPKYNVLFICIDDLRPELGCYGNKHIRSPNIDRLASGATLFKRQYVTVPTCGPSRACMLTGMRPRTTMEISNDVLELKQKANIPLKSPETFVDHLREQGYYTVGIGKVTHSPDGYIYKYREPKGQERELKQSWNEMLLDAGKWGTGWNAFFGYSDGTNRNDRNGEVKPYESSDVDDESYPDGLTAALAIKKLKELSQKEQPFFLGVGFFKPHLPFNAPKKYWDMYDESSIALTPSPGIPENVNTASLQNSGEFNGGYKLGDEKTSLEKPVSDAYARKLRHAYYASVSYTDAQIGKLLDELKKLGLDKNTIIVLWGDHGWHLGDDRVWGKHTLSEWALRSPLIVKMPGQKAGLSEKIISSIDIYPTLVELCGLKMPYQTDGKSFARLIKNPSDKTWSNTAYSYFNKGITMRTDRYRITKYFRSEMPSVELYDHKTDPYENHNVAGQNPETVKKLLPVLEKGNTGLYNNKP
jgi:iduronate 2-sulfatase